MKKIFIATFGSGQQFEGYYVEIHSESYMKAVEYMETMHNGKYCMVYDKERWDEWVDRATKNGFTVEVKLNTVKL